MGNPGKRATNQKFVSVGAILKLFDNEQDKYISREFQKYGYDLARELGDLKNRSLYIKLAKETPRGFLETARNFIKDASNVKSKPKLFMWKLSELKRKKNDTKVSNQSSVEMLDNLHVLVIGNVQGVGYRVWIKHKASGLGLTGWIKNNTNGTVEGYFEGKKETLEKMVKFLKRGPSLARVTKVDCDWGYREAEFDLFEVTY